MIDQAVRAKTACMMRCRNESRWIRRSLERTFQIAKTVVIWDDGSDDGMELEARLALGADFVVSWQEDGVVMYRSGDGASYLHYIGSPFRKEVVRPREAVNEIRDKNCLWSYCKVSVDFTYMLCLDGDEILSLEALRNWPQAIEQMQTVDLLHLPFVYVWDSEDRQRKDGIYGDVEGSYPPYAKLNFPRLFTIARLTGAQLFDTCFMWFGTQGSMHCGSIPRQNFQPNGGNPVPADTRLPVVHMGYIDEELRQRKFVFYNDVDPGNDAEGRYEHIVGRPDVHAPGPVELVPWVDA